MILTQVARLIALHFKRQYSLELCSSLSQIKVQVR